MSISVTQIRLTIPRVQVPPHIKALFYYNATVAMRLQDQGKVYAAIYKWHNHTLNATPQRPLSMQVYKGLNQTNQPLRKYQHVSSASSSNGEIELTFDDLECGQDYIVYLTRGNALPYGPVSIAEDDEVLEIRFTTKSNPSNAFGPLEPLIPRPPTSSAVSQFLRDEYSAASTNLLNNLAHHPG